MPQSAEDGKLFGERFLQIGWKSVCTEIPKDRITYKMYKAFSLSLHVLERSSGTDACGAASIQ